MLLTHYLHRLPSDYDMERVLSRAATRGALWDAVDGLVFKAFLYQLRGLNGSTRNTYASLYLWRDRTALLAFLSDGRFRNVVATFGRPAIETWMPLFAHRGNASQAKFLTLQMQSIPVDSDMLDVICEEEQTQEARMRQDDVFASTVALDLAGWRVLRINLLQDIPRTRSEDLLFSIAHLAMPGLASLARFS